MLWTGWPLRRSAALDGTWRRAIVRACSSRFSLGGTGPPSASASPSAAVASSSARTTSATATTRPRTTSDSYDARKRRWVIYNGYAEASKVPPDWHGWLHYTFDEPPTDRAAEAPRLGEGAPAQPDRARWKPGGRQGRSRAPASGRTRRATIRPGGRSRPCAARTKLRHRRWRDRQPLAVAAARCVRAQQRPARRRSRLERAAPTAEEAPPPPESALSAAVESPAVAADRGR